MATMIGLMPMGQLGRLETDRRADGWRHSHIVGLELVICPAVYEIWKWHFEMKRGLYWTAARRARPPSVDRSEAVTSFGALYSSIIPLLSPTACVRENALDPAVDGEFSHAQPIGYLLVRVAIGDETNSDACLLALIIDPRSDQ